ncbi:MAG: ribosome maturation factor RimP [Myxococcales bacterium]
MPKTNVDLEMLEKLVAPVCVAESVELVDVRLVPEGGLVLRVLIDVPNAETLSPGVGGVTLDDCTRVSRALSKVLDDDAYSDLLPSHYRLEVSSPGIERPLVKPSDFERFAGRMARVQTKHHVAERKNFTGTLVGLRDGLVVLRDDRGTDLDIPFSEIAKAHLIHVF